MVTKVPSPYSSLDPSQQAFSANSGLPVGSHSDRTMDTLLSSSPASNSTSSSPPLPVQSPPPVSSLPPSLILPRRPPPPFSPTLSLPPPLVSLPPLTLTAPPPSSNSPPPPMLYTPKESPVPPAIWLPSHPSLAVSPSPSTTSPPPPSDAHPPKKSSSQHPSTRPPFDSPLSPSTNNPPYTATEPPTLLPVPLSASFSAPPVNSAAHGSIPVTPQNPSTENSSVASTQTKPNIAADLKSRVSQAMKSGNMAVLGIIMGLLFLTLLVLSVWFIHRQKKRRSKFKPNYVTPSPSARSENSDLSILRLQYSAQHARNDSENNIIYSPDVATGSSGPCFTFEELSGATNGFSESNLLGEGGFGCVYKGVLVDGKKIAVKRLKSGGKQGEREFRAEVEIISRIHHRHLVSLVGYCISEHQSLLVYEYVPNDTLYYHLHVEGKSVIDWTTRVKIAAGAARGLAYLHEDCQPLIIHRDIKSSNILLDGNFEAKVADFGLAKLALELDLHTHVSTRVMGTFGYLAPEYASTGKLTEKSDVFSFGVVLLELITGRKPIDGSQPLGDESLVEWARPLLTQALETKDFRDLVDSRLGENYIATQMSRMIEAAAACVRHLAARRPRMSQIVRALESMEESVDLNNGMKPGQSTIYNSREHSAQIRMFQKLAFGTQDFSSNFYNPSQTT